jgi:hypothetical protein
LPKSTTTYTVTVDVEDFAVVPPVLPSPTAQNQLSSPPTCSDLLQQFNDALKGAQTESNVVYIGSEFTALTTESSSPCKSDADIATAKAAISVFQQATTAAVDNLSIANGQRLIVTLTRNANDHGLPTKLIGRYVISTPPSPSQWLVFYGATFVETNNQQFYSKTNPGTSPPTYTITQESNRNTWKFAPSVNFMWLPSKNFPCDSVGGCVARVAAWRGEESDIFGGLIAGLGFGTGSGTTTGANPVVKLGYGVGWGYNVVVSAGVAMHQEQRLAGQYNPGQIVMENLTSDSLAQTVYRPGFYLEVAFRFGSNPFTSKSSSGGTQGSGSPTNAGAKKPVTTGQ